MQTEEETEKRFRQICWLNGIVISILMYEKNLLVLGKLVESSKNKKSLSHQTYTEKIVSFLKQDLNMYKDLHW